MVISCLLLLWCHLWASEAATVTVTVSPTAVTGVTPTSITVAYTADTGPIQTGATITISSTANVFATTTVAGTSTITVDKCLLTESPTGRAQNSIAFAVTNAPSVTCSWASGTSGNIVIPAGYLATLPSSGFTISVATTNPVNAATVSSAVTTVAGAITTVSAGPRDSADASDALTAGATPGLLTVGFTPNVNLGPNAKITVTASGTGVTTIFLTPTAAPAAFAIGTGSCQATWTTSGSTVLVAVFTLSGTGCQLAGNTAVARSNFKIPSTLLAANPAVGTTVIVSVTALTETNIALANDAAATGKYTTTSAPSTNTTQSPSSGTAASPKPSASPSGALQTQLLPFGALFTSIMLFAVTH